MSRLPQPDTCPTEIELEILDLVSRGENLVQIARKLYRSPATIKTHVRRLCTRLNARSQTHLVRRGFELGYLKKSEPQGVGPELTGRTSE